MWLSEAENEGGLTEWQVTRFGLRRGSSFRDHADTAVLAVCEVLGPKRAVTAGLDGRVVVRSLG